MDVDSTILDTDRLVMVTVDLVERLRAASRTTDDLVARTQRQVAESALLLAWIKGDGAQPGTAVKR